jgi:hypothetical protein
MERMAMSGWVFSLALGLLAGATPGCAVDTAELAATDEESAAGDDGDGVDLDDLDPEARKKYTGTLVKCDVRCNSAKNKTRRTFTACTATEAGARQICRDALKQLNADIPGCMGIGAAPASSRPRSCDPYAVGGGGGGDDFGGDVGGEVEPIGPKKGVNVSCRAVCGANSNLKIDASFCGANAKVAKKQACKLAMQALSGSYGDGCKPREVSTSTSSKPCVAQSVEKQGL